MVFIVRPYIKNLPRAVLKPPKVYFFDNADVKGHKGTRFENLVATIKKALHQRQAFGGRSAGKSYGCSMVKRKFFRLRKS